MEEDKIKTYHALSEAAKAVKLWQASKSEQTQGNTSLALQQLSYAAAVVESITGESVSSLQEFLDMMKRPVSEWLDIEVTDRLLDSFGITELTREIFSEAFSPEDAQQSVVKIARDNLRGKKYGQQQYTKLRRGLIEKPVADLSIIQKLIIGTELGVRDFYEDFSPDVIHQHKGEDTYFPCPVCSWPMHIRRNEVECFGHSCRYSGARFLLKDNQLQPLGALSAPKAQSVAHQLKLKRGIWRYTLLPGLEEVALADLLSQIDLLEVSLWPCMDQFDIGIVFAKGEISETVWKVDVKDWYSPIELAKNILETSDVEEITYVVPDAKKKQVNILKEQCSPLTGTQFLTSSQLVTQIKDYLRKQDVLF